jgi:hypothetical protein
MMRARSRDEEASIPNVDLSDIEDDIDKEERVQVEDRSEDENEDDNDKETGAVKEDDTNDVNCPQYFDGDDDENSSKL